MLVLGGEYVEPEDVPLLYIFFLSIFRCLCVPGVCAVSSEREKKTKQTVYARVIETRNHDSSILLFLRERNTQGRRT